MNNSELSNLVFAYRESIYDSLNEFNDVRLPSIEHSLGRTIDIEFRNENQRTVEMTKLFSRPLNNTIWRNVNKTIPEFIECTTDGYDYIYDDIPIEDKNSFGLGNAWVGNGFKKTDWHILKRFRFDELSGKIAGAFICMVDLSQCKDSKWSDKTIKTNRSTLKFGISDASKIHVIFGDITCDGKTKRKLKYVIPLLEDV